MHTIDRRPLKYAALLVAASACAVARAQCEPTWSTVALTTPGPYGSNFVRAMSWYGGEMVVGGCFSDIGGQPIMSLAASGDGGATWHSLGGNVTSEEDSAGTVYAILVRPEGLYLGGAFTAIGGQPFAGIARWDGTQWHALAQGLQWTGYTGIAQSLFEHNGQPTVAGWIFSIGQTPAYHITRWNGDAWDFFSPHPPSSHGMQCAAPWNGGIVASISLPISSNSNMTFWDGAQWSELPATQSAVEVLTDFQGDLYSGQYGSNGVRCVTRLSGSAWVETAPLPSPTAGQTVYALHSFGGELYAGGSFRTTAGTGPKYVARWDGTTWLPVGTGPGATARSLATINGELWAGCVGRIARYACACYANCDASTAAPTLSANDFQCFLNQFAAGGAYANCDGSSAAPVHTANDFQCFLNRFAVGCN